MKIQNLAIIFIVIMLPISMVLTVFVQNQVETLHNQIAYDNKLNRATYDALKAFQLNTINNDTSDLTNSKLRDIEASANTFFNSIASNFNMAGFNQDVLKSYIPALVYTMYDGYYIYSPYNNTLDENKINDIKQDDGTTIKKSDKELLDKNNNPNATYSDGDKIYGLKPYIHYSSRYKKGSVDVIITYSLDSYITIQGKIGDEDVFKFGYLLDDVSINTGNNTASYRGITIDSNEETKEYIDETDTQYTYIKLNGVKYYKNEDNNKWFSILNNESYIQDDFNPNTTGAFEYYREAYEFTEWLKNGKGRPLLELTGKDAVDENGNELSEEDQNKFGNYKIFEFKESTGINIEDPNSNFTQQRLAVIRYSIEKNLSIAIANYNNYTGVQTNFQMPKLKEDEWEQILNNISIISFMQGLSIGGKIYNGYSIIINNKNKETVNEDSLYIVTNDGNYHKPNDKDLIDNNIISGILNIDFERKSVIKEGTVNYFFPNRAIGCYSSIISNTNVETVENLNKYIARKRWEFSKSIFYCIRQRTLWTI